MQIQKPSSFISSKIFNKDSRILCLLLSLIFMKSCAPVLIIAFNRPDSCKRVFESLRGIKPARVFFAVDGARENNILDVINCEKTRKLQAVIDWPCEVRTYFRETNRGCRNAPVEAISWFFEHVEMGIILEDDCVPTSEFLIFATELLDYYLNTVEVGMISGNNWYGYQTNLHESYHFSNYPHIWGWATWKNRWALYDGTLKPYLSQLESIKKTLGHSDRYRTLWWRYVDAVIDNPTTWDIQWAIALHANHKICIQPRYNLVSNIGFSSDATHTNFEYNIPFFLNTRPIVFPLTHPCSIILDHSADKKMEERFTSFWCRCMTFLGAKGGWITRRIIFLVALIEEKLHAALIVLFL